MNNGFLSIEDLLPKKSDATTPVVRPTRAPQYSAPANTQQSAATPAQSNVINTEDSPAPTTDTTDNTVHLDANLADKIQTFDLETAEREVKQHASMLGVPYIQLDGFPIGPEIISILPEETARKNNVVAFFRLENQMRVGALDPTSPGTLTVLTQLEQEHPGTNIVAYMVSPRSLAKALELYKNVTKVQEVEYGVHITAEQLKQYEKEITSYDILEQRLKTTNMTDVFAMLVSMALTSGSSDIHIEAEKESAVVRFRIDGVLIVVAHLPLTELPRLVSRVKAIAELKLNITEIPQDGRISIEFEGGENLDIRVSTLPSAFGESIVMRLLKSSSVGLSFEDLGMRPLQFARLKAEIEKPNGMIITTGPTGSGKTTTLYAILNKLNTEDTKIITLENPVEYKLKGIVQSQVDPSKKYTFALGLRAILRQDPDVVMVGEIRDLETAKTAVEASLTGHIMLSTIHTNDAAGAVPRFLGMGVEGIFLAPALNAVIGQRLVRRVCSNCVESYTPTAEEITRATEWIAAIPEKSGEEKPDITTVDWKHGKGCVKCANTGYKGRVGIYEIFTMNAEIEQEILSSAISEYRMKELLHETGMVTMGQDGILKAVEGITTLDEIFRVAKG